MNYQKILEEFIVEARKRGFSDADIRRALQQKNWQPEMYEKVFDSLNPKFKLKNQISVFLSNETLAVLEKRAKKNMLTISEQIEDIIRRSCALSGTSQAEDKDIDDKLIGIFSRKTKKNKKAKKN